MGGRVKSNEWYTPLSVIKAAKAVMGSIELDPASCELANQIVGAARYFTEADNGLIQEWDAYSVWLNPPYSYITHARGMESGDRPKSIIKQWVDKLIGEYKAGHIQEAILLTKADPKQSWFQPLWEFLICFARDRIYFNRPGGLEPEKMMFGTAFVYLGPHEEKFVDMFSRFGRVVKAIDPPKQRHIQYPLWEAIHNVGPVAE